MTPKQTYYETTATALAPLWEQDALMSEQNPERWQHARDLDDLLVSQRDDPNVKIGEYRMKCLALRALYVEPVAMAGGER